MNTARTSAAPRNAMDLRARSIPNYIHAHGAISSTRRPALEMDTAACEMYSMEDAPRLPPYRKDPATEQLLARVNERLAPLQSERETLGSGPRRPVLFVIGAPRSGTTLVSQLLAHSGAFGYVSNFLARFWLAPRVGAELEQIIGVRSQPLATPFVSEHGVTDGPAAPHEFGYFWSQVFDRGQETHRLTPDELAQLDAPALLRRLASLETFFGQPMVFKNSTWCTFQAAWLAEQLPTAVFLACHRDPLFVAQSLVEVRRRRYGDVNTWWSIRPPSYRRLLTLPWWQQVVGQALDIQRTMAEALSPVAAGRVVRVDYRRLCDDPHHLWRDLAVHLPGESLPARPAWPDRFTCTDVPRLPSEEWELLTRALEEQTGGAPDA